MERAGTPNIDSVGDPLSTRPLLSVAQTVVILRTNICHWTFVCSYSF